jgi:S-adenosylmethionine:tRNA ribosyltransferase-isomerase
LLVGTKDRIVDDYFFNLYNYLTPGDLIIFNDSKVFRSRIICQEKNVNKEIFIEKILTKFEALCLLGNFKGLSKGNNYMINNELEFTCLSCSGLLKHLRFKHPIKKLISSFGQIPLPPYIKRKPNIKDSEFYQTIYASNKGSVAAPTAGLHFDYNLISKIKKKGILTDNITLHVGAATFLPIKEQNINNHEMHSESVFISKELKKKIISVKKNKKKIYAVGTTSLRAL